MKSLAELLSLHARSARLRLLRRKSFTHELLGNHEQQASLHGAGFTAFDHTQRKLTYEYVVPSRITSAAHMPLSAMLSLVDECTTWASIACDRLRRPGVSISLETNLTASDRPAQAGERLVFESIVQKVGRSVGFIQCEVFEAATGRKIAQASHTKFLAMGAAWDFAFGPALPLTEGLIVPLLSIDRTLPHIDADDAAAFEELLAPTRPIGTTDSTVSFTCRDVHLQQAHMLFGGCQAMMHERAAMLTSRRAPVQGTASHLASIRVNYLASSKQGDELEARVSVADGPTWNGAGCATTSRLFGSSRSGGKEATIRSEAQMEIVLIT